MGQKVYFNHLTKTIEVTQAPTGSPGVVELDVKIDIYSDGKEDWLADPTLNKFLFPVTAIGGDPISATKALGSTFFLEYGWKIKPYEADHQLAVNGNLYSRDGSNPYIVTTGSYNVQIINQVSNLVDSVQLQLTEIQQASFNDAVHVDPINGQAGTAYPIGTPRYPVNNMTDAIIIDGERGFDKFHIMNDITFGAETILTDAIVAANNAQTVTITILPSANLTNVEFQDATITGTLDGGSVIRSCVVTDLLYVNGFIFQSMIQGTVTLIGATEAHFLQCYSGTPGTGTPIIDMNGGGTPLAMRAYSGGIELINLTTPTSVSLDFISGHAVLGSTVTEGSIVIRGAAHLTNNGVGPNVTLTTKGLTNPDAVAQAVWNKESNAPGSPTTSYGELVENMPRSVWEVEVNGVVPGSFGEAAKQVAFLDHVIVDVNNGAAGTAYPLGTQQAPVNNIADAVTIGNSIGSRHIFVEEDATVLATDNVDGFKISGAHATKSEITLAPGCSTIFTEFSSCTLTGEGDGYVTVRDSLINDYDNFSGIAHQTMINGTITLAGNTACHFLDCFSGVPGQGTPTIDGGGAGGPGFAFRNYNGGIKVENVTDAIDVSMDMNSGQIVLDGTVTAGTFVLRGISKLTDNSGGTATVDSSDLINELIRTMQLDVTDIVAVTSTILKYHKNRTLINETAYTLTVFDDDRVTPLIVFDLKDETGTASITSIFERIPVGSP